jgi:deazaflavin-dependent oxidoreductase (nitroreductase family)
MDGSPQEDPFAARLYFIPRAMRRPQAAVVAMLRRYFERAPGWVILTTRGRRTGLPREVLLPCERSHDEIFVISTYGFRSQWIRNLKQDPRVWVTCGGWTLCGLAEIVEDREEKHAIVGAHPFFPPAPLAPIHLVLRTLLRPLLVAMLRRWVTPRPMVRIRRAAVEASPGTPPNPARATS